MGNNKQNKITMKFALALTAALTSATAITSGGAMTIATPRMTAGSSPTNAPPPGCGPTYTTRTVATATMSGMPCTLAATATGSGRSAPTAGTTPTTATITAAGGTGMTTASGNTGCLATTSPPGTGAGEEHSGTLTRLPTAPEDPWLRGPGRRCQPP